MAKKMDLTGKEFGKLIVIEEDFSHKEKNKRHRYWKCKCSCGNEKIIRQDALTGGITKSCGCITKKNLIGKRFGRLVVVKENTNRSKFGEVQWDCLCDCGNTITVLGSNLRSGNTQSCGCLNKEKVMERFKDISGQRFGKLIAIEPTLERTKYGSIKWKCKCDCGNEVIVSSGNLVNGGTQSCGCMTQSHGAFAIESLLKENNIQYKKEKTFDTCRFPDTNALARFDFYVDNKYLIEFDGIQHFEERSDGLFKDDLETVQKRDTYKNQWAKNNNYSLIRIPYTHEKDLCIEDLLLETSNFIIS